MLTTSLNGIWKVSGFDENGNAVSFDAKVPGTVHTAMMDAGLIENLYYADNAKKYQWIE